MPLIRLFHFPLSIIKFKAVLFSIAIIFLPYLLNNVRTPFDLLLIQSFIMFFVLDTVPAMPIFYKYFPVFKRFTASAFLYALSRAIMYVVTSFFCIYLTDYYGNYGLLFVVIPVIIGYVWGILHFEKLEKESGSYPQEKKDFVPEIVENTN